jgi:hypothetical protein
MLFVYFCEFQTATGPDRIISPAVDTHSSCIYLEIGSSFLTGNTKGAYKGDNDEYNVHVDDDTHDDDMRNAKMMMVMTGMIMRTARRWI